MKKDTPEMPAARKARLTNMGAKEDMVDIIISDPVVAFYFDEVINGKDSAFATLTSNYLVADIFGLLKKENKTLTRENFPTPSTFVTLLEMIGKGELSSRGAKDMLPLMLLDKTIDVRKVAEEKGFIQKNDPALLQKIVDEVIAENPIQVTDYKSGKESMFMFFVGQCMKKSKGAGNPGIFQELLKEALV